MQRRRESSVQRRAAANAADAALVPVPEPTADEMMQQLLEDSSTARGRGEGTERVERFEDTSTRELRSSNGGGMLGDLTRPVNPPVSFAPLESQGKSKESVELKKVVVERPPQKERVRSHDSFLGRNVEGSQVADQSSSTNRGKGVGGHGNQGHETRRDRAAAAETMPQGTGTSKGSRLGETYYVGWTMHMLTRSGVLVFKKWLLLVLVMG